MAIFTALVFLAAAIHLCADNGNTTSALAENIEAADPRLVRGTWVAPQVEDHTPEQVAHRIKSRHEFAAFTSTILDQMGAGRLHLHEARDRMLLYCVAHYPAFLSHVHLIETGSGTLKVKLAHCLLRFIKDQQLTSSEAEISEQRMQGLEAEYDDIVHEDQPESSATPSAHRTW